MSPSEHDLRAALRAGDDGPGPNADALVAAGRTRRSQRRVRIAGGLVAAAFVAAGATGLALIPNGSTGSGSSEEGGQAQSQESGPVAAAPAPPNSRTGGGCPDTYPAQALPGGGGTGQFGAHGKLFAEPVATITACAYGAADGNGRLTEQTQLTGATASRLVTSLESATTGAPSCPTVVPGAPDTSYRYALVPVDRNGRTMRTVTVTLNPVDCPNQVTNGTAIRYLWQPPSGLDGVFRTLDRPTHPSQGRATGSPIRS